MQNTDKLKKLIDYICEYTTEKVTESKVSQKSNQIPLKLLKM